MQSTVSDNAQRHRQTDRQTMTLPCHYGKSATDLRLIAQMEFEFKAAFTMTQVRDRVYSGYSKHEFALYSSGRRSH